MSRYIDADKMLAYISRLLGVLPLALLNEYEKNGIDIVRCKECKHNPKGIGWVSCPMTGANTRKPDDFCSYGSRSEKPNKSERSE